MAIVGTRSDGNTQFADLFSGSAVTVTGAVTGASAAISGAVAAASVTASTPQADGFVIVQPSEFGQVPVSNIAYAQSSIAGASSTTISTLRLTDSGSNATGLVHLDLTALAGRTTAGKGLSITGVTIVYSLVTAVLTAAPTVAAISQTFGAAGASAAAPTAAATAGGAVTSSPVSPPVAIPTAGQFYTVSYSFATPIALNVALARTYLEIGFPMTATGVAHLAAASVAFTNSPL